MLFDNVSDIFIYSCSWCVSLQRWRIHTRFNSVAYNSTLPAPQPDDAVKEYPEKITNIVDEISKLTLVEVADLNELLKVKKVFVRNMQHRTIKKIDNYDTR